jgi:N,N'-diacetylbacillosaminyl-diphospho-undecaprenol alpha-1,3-N-acetylgalactosaminyltransferase
LTGLGDAGGILLIAGCTENECIKALGHTVNGVKALGYLNDLKQFYAASDVLTLPSRHEGFPYSLLEGSAAGLALIGTDIPGIRSAIKEHETGMLVPFNETSKLCRAILKMYHDSRFRLNLGVNARKRVEEEFDRKFVLTSLLDFYNLLLCSA